MSGRKLGLRPGWRLGLPVLAALFLSWACNDDETSTDVCMPLAQEICYDGPAEVAGIGACRLGVRTCLRDGSDYSACAGDVLPIDEDCGTAVDDDCDGLVNEDCACIPGEFLSCYTGSADTMNTGACQAGKQSCNHEGTGYGECIGEVVPVMEDCSTLEDEDCDGVINQVAVCACAPGDTAPCYTGPDGTQGVGICAAGIQTCLDTGGVFGDCVGEVLPLPAEDCDTDEDDDCNGESNEPAANCACADGETRSCYSGPSGTADVGQCRSGSQTCDASGNGFGDCVGDIAPAIENCASPADDNCNGEANEIEAGCECSPGEMAPCYSGPEFTVNVGTCRPGHRSCASDGHWFPCQDEVIPTDDDCATPLDENCDGSLNEATSGCPCRVEDPKSLASEDCVLDYGEPAWRNQIVGMPHEIAADGYDETFLLLDWSDEDPELDPQVFFEPTFEDEEPVARIAQHGPNGDFFWGKEIVAATPPEAGNGPSYNMNVSSYGVVALTTPVLGGETSALGEDSFSWPQTAFRILYSIDPYGYLIFATSLPRYNSEATNAVHAIAARNDGGVFYVNGPVNSHLHRFDYAGDLVWTVDLNLDLDDMAIAPASDGGVLLAFTAGGNVNLGQGVLLPLPNSPSDLIVAKYTAAGVLTWAIRPVPSTAVHSAQQSGNVLAIVDQTSLIRIDVKDGPIVNNVTTGGSLLSVDLLQGAVIPGSPFALVGTNAVAYARNGVGPTDFGLGIQQPYGALQTGSFIALSGVGGLHWARSPLANATVVGTSPSDTVYAAFSATTHIDLDGTVWPLEDPAIYLARLTY